MELSVRTILASQIAEEVLKYSRLSLRLVTGRGLLMYSLAQIRAFSYTKAVFSGIDFPEKMSSPVNELRSM